MALGLAICSSSFGPKGSDHDARLPLAVRNSLNDAPLYVLAGVAISPLTMLDVSRFAAGPLKHTNR